MSSNPTVTLNVPTPKMGGRKSDTIVWTGGIPKPDWSALDERSSKPYSTFCHRNPSDWNEENKANFRRSAAPKGVQIKSKSNNLYSIKSSLMAHMRKHGLDTVFYVPDTQDKTKVVNVIEQHSKFELSYVKAEIRNLRREWDEYDEANNETARDVLINCLESSFMDQLRPHNLDAMSAAEVWMTIIRSIQSTSTQRFDDIRQKIRDLSPLSLPHQDILVYCRQIREHIHDLVQADEWHWSLLLNIIKNLLLASNGTFQSQFHAYRISVDRMLRHISSISSYEIENYIRDSALH